VFRNGASSSTKEGSVFLCRRYVCCTAVSARVYPRCHGVQITMDSAHSLSLHYIQGIQRFPVNEGLCSGLCLNLRNVVIFDKTITWRLHIEMIEAKAFGIFIRIYSLLRSEGLSADIKLTLHKALIRSLMTYVCLAWESAADICLLKLRRLKKKKRFCAPLEIFQGAHRSAICTRLSTFRMYTIT
jgi:hypothetical protein